MSIKHAVKSFGRRFGWSPEISSYRHVQVGLATEHIARFEGTPGFEEAYARSVQAAGWDYRVPYQVHQALWCASVARRVSGHIVELGTGRGFVMSAVLQAWPDWAASDRSMYLFDTYESGHIGGKDEGRRGKVSPYYAESFEAAQANFAEWPRVHLIRGDVFHTIPRTPVEQVAFLHIDLNYYKPEVFGLRYYWPKIPTGGVVLLDDYAFRNREQQYDAMNAEARELGISILSTASGQGIIVK